MNRAALSVKGAPAQQGSLDRQAEANLEGAKILVSSKPKNNSIHKLHIQSTQNVDITFANAESRPKPFHLKLA